MNGSPRSPPPDQTGRRSSGCCRPQGPHSKSHYAKTVDVNAFCRYFEAVPSMLSACLRYQPSMKCRSDSIGRILRSASARSLCWLHERPILGIRGCNRLGAQIAASDGAFQCGGKTGISPCAGQKEVRKRTLLKWAETGRSRLN